MPYGAPWPDSAYICRNCQSEGYHPSPFCAYCGVNRSVPEGNVEIREAVRDLDRITDLLRSLKDREVRLWDYSISHSELQLRFAHHRTGIEEEVRSNTVIMCADTKRIQCGTSSWPADLTVNMYEGKYHQRYLLKDVEQGVEIDCGLLVIYELMEPKLFSDRKLDG